MTTPQEREKLEPCPFCDAAPMRVHHNPVLPRMDTVLCDHCGARGPHTDGTVVAIAAWNTRASNHERAQDKAEVEALRAAVFNDALLFERFATNMFECWRGTGGLMEEGSASNDYSVWGNEAHNRVRHLRQFREPRALIPKPIEHGEDG